MSATNKFDSDDDLFYDARKSLESEEKLIIKNIKYDFKLLKNKTDSVDKYILNEEKFKDFLKKIEDNTELFCEKIYDYTVKCAEEVLSSSKDSDDMSTDAFCIRLYISDPYIDCYNFDIKTILFDEVLDYYNEILDYLSNLSGNFQERWEYSQKVLKYNNSNLEMISDANRRIVDIMSTASSRISLFVAGFERAIRFKKMDLAKKRLISYAKIIDYKGRIKIDDVKWYRC